MPRLLRACALLLCAAAALVPAAASAAPHRRALLIAVTKYDRGQPGDLPDLHTLADVQAIRDVLTRRYHFDSITVKTAPDETTHRAIVESFRKLLIEPTQPGDIVYFHYSGHGAQTPDPTHRKLSGTHSCLVPSDYVSDYQKAHDHAQVAFDNYILDDEVRDLLNELKAKQPSNVTLTFDSCYSGTITRGSVRVRGVGLRNVYIPPALRRPTLTRGGQGGENAQKPEAAGPGGLLEQDDAGRLGYVVISATRSDQMEPETPGPGGSMGLLSWALTQVLASPPADMTYRELGERLTALTTGRYPDVTPQVEGRRDQEVFGVKTAPPEPYVMARVRGRAVLLDAGALQGVTKGSRFALYPTGTLKPAGTPLATGTVEAVDSLSARLALDPAYRKMEPGALRGLDGQRAFETEHRFGDDQLRVDASALAAHPRGAALLAALRQADVPEALRAYRLVSGAAVATDGGWDVRAAPARDLDAAARARLADLTAGAEQPAPPGPNDVVLLRADGAPFAVLPDGPGLAEAIRRRLEGEARWRALSNLRSAGGAGLQVTVELLEATGVERDAQNQVTKVGAPAPITPTRGGQLELEAGRDLVQLRVTNLSKQTLWVTILDLRPDGTVGPVLPLPDMNEITSNRFEPGQSAVLPLPYVFEITPPFGTETFKAIATTRPTDFSFLLTPDLARGAPADLSPLQRLLQSAMLGKRVGSVGAAPSTYAVDQVTFIAQPARPAK